MSTFSKKPYCTWRESRFAFLFDLACSRFAPVDKRDRRIVLISSCWLLLMERFGTLLYFMVVKQNDGKSGIIFTRQRILLLWQTHVLLLLAYFQYSFMTYQDEWDLVQFIPLCFTLLIDQLVSITLGKIIITHRLIGFIILAHNALCTSVEQYTNCKFINKP